MSKEYNAALQRQLEAFIEKVGSQSKAATAIGYSTGTLSTYRVGKYNGDIPKLEAHLSEFFSNQEEAKALHSTDGYVPTSISQQVYNTIRICHLKGGFAIECGDAGIGKTRAAQKYIEDYPGSALYVAVNPCLVSITAFMKLLCRHLKAPVGRKDDMWFEIDARLRGGKKVLIIDEAQHLPIKTIDSIRAFFDSNPDLGIMLIGNVDTVTNQVGRRRESFSQIKNRTKLTEIRRVEHITRQDVQLLFPALADQEKEIDLLHVIVQGEQGIRGTMNLYSNALDNEDTSYEGLLAMAKAMHIVMY